METRNYKWANAEHTLLNFYFKDESLGWVPYTTHAQMEDELGKGVWDTRDSLEIAEYEEPEGYEELLALGIRSKRDTLIAETDYLVLADYPISQDKLEEIKTYRQALRNITKQEGFPRNVTFPTKPSLE